LYVFNSVRRKRSAYTTKYSAWIVVLWCGCVYVCYIIYYIIYVIFDSTFFVCTLILVLFVSVWVCFGTSKLARGVFVCIFIRVYEPSVQFSRIRIFVFACELENDILRFRVYVKYTWHFGYTFTRGYRVPMCNTIFWLDICDILIWRVELCVYIYIYIYTYISSLRV